MNLVDYDLAHEYRYERPKEAAARRRARQAAAAPRSRASHHLRVPTARQVRTWISTLPGLIPRRIGAA